MQSGPEASALLAHIVAQTRSNIDFLVSQNVIRASDAATILSKLEVVDTERITNESQSSLGANLDTGRERESRSPVGALGNLMKRASFGGRERERTPERTASPPKAVMPLRRVIPPLPSSASLSPGAAALPQAKALWDYNENGSVSTSIIPYHRPH